MNFEYTSWTVAELIRLYDDGKLNLNPPYQRNPIWLANKQKALIASIKSHSALPAFFVFKKSDGVYEMVDGQQRTRTLISYHTTGDLDEKKGVMEDFKTSGFLQYPLNVTVIDSLGDGERIEEFYARINSSGVPLNRPETLKAKHFDTAFLSLVEGLTSREDFVNLKLFPADNSKKRMLDRDLVEELVVLSLCGITDKKEQVDRMYSKGVDESEESKATSDFEFAINVFKSFESIKPISKTRYRQRNDFYTLFGYIISNKGLETKTYQHFYRILLGLELGIRPDKNGCEPLVEYAFNCVSQSNSAKARGRRFEILEGIIGVAGNTHTEAQNKIILYYGLSSESTMQVENRTVFVPKTLAAAVEKKELKG
jgi:hypothetical protein